MSQGPYFQGQPQSFDSQNATLGSVAYSSGGMPVSGHSQNATGGSIQYPSGGQPTPGGMPVPPHANPAFAGQQPSMGAQRQFVPEMPGFAPAAIVYPQNTFGHTSTGEYGQPQMPMQSQQQSQQRFVGVPPGMTRESMNLGYVEDPNWSFRDSFGQKRNNCCTIS